MNRIVLASLSALLGASAFAAPVTYTLDPNHTYPSFAADHFGGLSVWRGKFDSTSGKVVYDKDAKSGSIEVTVDMTSIDFGMPKLNEHAKSAEMFDAAKYPTATFSGKLAKFNGANPTEAEGTLTMHGVTKPFTMPFTFAHSGSGGTFHAAFQVNRVLFGVGKSGDTDDNISLDLTVPVTAK